MTRLPRVPLAEWPDLLAALVVASMVEVGIRTTPLPRLATRLGTPLALAAQPARPIPDGVVPSAADRRRLQAARRVMRHWPFGNTCLRNALVMGNRVRRLDPVLRVGVAKVDGQVQAHAWVEFAGGLHDPIGGASDYHVLDHPPTSVG